MAKWQNIHGFTSGLANAIRLWNQADTEALDMQFGLLDRALAANKILSELEIAKYKQKYQQGLLDTELLKQRQALMLDAARTVSIKSLMNKGFSYQDAYRMVHEPGVYSDTIKAIADTYTLGAKEAYVPESQVGEKPAVPESPTVAVPAETPKLPPYFLQKTEEEAKESAKAKAKAEYELEELKLKKELELPKYTVTAETAKATVDTVKAERDLKLMQIEDQLGTLKKEAEHRYKQLESDITKIPLEEAKLTADVKYQNIINMFKERQMKAQIDYLEAMAKLIGEVKMDKELSDQFLRTISIMERITSAQSKLFDAREKTIQEKLELASSLAKNLTTETEYEFSPDYDTLSSQLADLYNILQRRFSSNISELEQAGKMGVAPKKPIMYFEYTPVYIGIDPVTKRPKYGLGVMDKQRFEEMQRKYPGVELKLKPLPGKGTTAPAKPIKEDVYFDYVPIDIKTDPKTGKTEYIMSDSDRAEYNSLRNARPDLNIILRPKITPTQEKIAKPMPKAKPKNSKIEEEMIKEFSEIFKD